MDAFRLFGPDVKGAARVIGIDLGTTNSAAAEAASDGSSQSRPSVRCLALTQPTLDGEHTGVLVPSVVAVADGSTLVGEGAKRLRLKPAQSGLVEGQTIFYECKNEIGLRRTYAHAPDGFRSPAEIVGHVLNFIWQRALE